MSALSNANHRMIVVMHGDQTGEELLQEALRVLAPEVIGFRLEFQHFDLSLENRRATQNGVVKEAAAAMRQTGLGLKAATITPPEQNDVGSPNAILREEIDGTVILRTGRRIPRVRPVGGVHAPISVVRMAVDDAYGAKEWREMSPEGDELAYRTEKISRSVCRNVAEFSFQHAQRMGARVFGGPKYTVSPVYEGMFKEEMDAAAARHPDVAYEPQLIDATLALLMKIDGDALVIPTLNRDGDLISDLVLQMFGSIAGSESQVLAFDDDLRVKVVMTEAPHGTAPALQGKNIANPMAMILAAAATLPYMETPKAETASRAIYESVFEAVHNENSTPDLGGRLSTTEFTDDVIQRVGTKLEVWSGLRN
ncbi:MAG TPA: isocitrate/isopropylmalate family dehydrogenase [Anaerolineales bacterium]|jgi:isocitrate/isopropylmalate dehydrogenase|nr:isocitrate/isopropylmalate family dehydrogenase [Anaerolineales bacterium]